MKTHLLIPVPGDLHPASKALVRDFASAIAEKLKSAEDKYGYSDGWKTEEWEAECREHMLNHIDKGDPRDVAIYCAFMWARGWSTAAGACTSIPKLREALKVAQQWMPTPQGALTPEAKADATKVYEALGWH